MDSWLLRCFTRPDAVLAWDHAAADATAKVKSVLAAPVTRRGPVGFLHLTDYPSALCLTIANKTVTDLRKDTWHCVIGSSVPEAEVSNNSLCGATGAGQMS